MKNTLLFLSFLCMNSLNAQEKDYAFLTIHYAFTHIIDTTMPEKPHKENMLLHLAAGKSIYYSSEIAAFDSAYKMRVKQFENQMKAGENPVLDFRGLKKVNKNLFYRKFGEVQIGANFFNNLYYIIEQDSSKNSFQWTLQPDTITILGVHCQKAVTRFSGRDYEAWFSPELPYQTGPWKFHGLPGLILQISDSKKQVSFSATMIEDSRSKKIEVKLPDKGIKTTKEGFNKMMKDFAAAFLGQGAVDGISVKKIQPARVNNTGFPIPNNPIELEDQSFL